MHIDVTGPQVSSLGDICIYIGSSLKQHKQKKGDFFFLLRHKPAKTKEMEKQEQQQNCESCKADDVYYHL